MKTESLYSTQSNQLKKIGTYFLDEIFHDATHDPYSSPPYQNDIVSDVGQFLWYNRLMRLTLGPELLDTGTHSRVGSDPTTKDEVSQYFEVNLFPVSSRTVGQRLGIHT